MNTKEFITLGTAFSTLAIAGLEARQRPNILLIISDQHSADKMSYLGDRWLQTPVMDSLARNGYCFTNAYCAHPLSTPSRFSMMTGQHPADYGVRFNADMSADMDYDYDRVAEAYPTAMGNVFRASGYDVYYSGKEHLPNRNTKPGKSHIDYGFEVNVSKSVREPLSGDVAKFLATKTPQSNPFLLVVSYLNPHDICEFDDYLFFDQLSEKEKESKNVKIADVADQFRRAGQESGYPSPEFYAKFCPPLRYNHGDTEPRPAGVKNRLQKYDEPQWKMYNWVYNRLIEQVDDGMRIVLDALRRQGLSDNTIVMYLADHGDMQAAHGMEQKSAPYDECQKVPFVICGPGVEKGVVNRITAVNTGIDLLPTLCGLAGIAIPENLPGESLKPAVTAGRKLDRKYVFPSAHDWFQVTDGRYKYTLFEVDRPGNELLVDTQTDPGEMVNLAGDPQYKSLRDELRKVLLDNLASRGVTPAYRSTKK